MKTRQGFVSNSSSSSFIILENSFPTVRSLATYMITKKIEDYKYSMSKSEFKEFAKEEKNLIKRLEDVDENQPISFTSCNYDTYIKKVADCYLVSTCNNVDWDIMSRNNLTSSAKEELQNMLKNIPLKHDDYRQIERILNGDDQFYSFGNDYYSLNYEIIGTETNERCSIHTDEYMWDTVKYGKICLICNREKLIEDKPIKLPRIKNQKEIEKRLKLKEENLLKEEEFYKNLDDLSKNFVKGQVTTETIKDLKAQIKELKWILGHDTP